MAQPANLVDRYRITRAVREDLSNTIYDISPEETPLFSNIGKGKASNTYFEWQTNALVAANQDNAAVEGDEATLDSRPQTKRLGNYTQIFRKVVGVSGTSEAVDKAGMKGALAYEMARSSAELKRDIEARIAGNKAAVAGNSSTARQTASLGSFLITNVNKAAGGTAPTLSGSTEGYPNAAYTNGTARAFTEALLKDVFQKVWTQGGSLDFVMVGASNKQAASAFAGIAQQRHEVGNGKQASIIGAADVYVGDFGSVSIVANRFSAADTAFVVDPDYAEVAYLRDFQTSDLAKTGDSDKKMILVELGLRVKNELAHGAVRDLTTP